MQKGKTRATAVPTESSDFRNLYSYHVYGGIQHAYQALVYNQIFHSISRHSQLFTFWGTYIHTLWSSEELFRYLINHGILQVLHAMSRAISYHQIINTPAAVVVVSPLESRGRLTSLVSNLYSSTWVRVNIRLYYVSPISPTLPSLFPFSSCLVKSSCRSSTWYSKQQKLIPNNIRKLPNNESTTFPLVKLQY